MQSTKKCRRTQIPLLVSMPKSYEMTIGLLAEHPEVGRELASTKILGKSQRENAAKENTTKAIVGRTNRQKPGPDKLQSQRPNATLNAIRSNKPSNATKAKCSHCNKAGHNAEQCWKNHPEKLPDWLKERTAKKRKLQFD